MMNKKIIKILAGILFVLVIFYFTHDEWITFSDKIKNIRPISLTLISILFVTSQILNSIIFRKYLTVFKVKISLKESFHLTSIQAIGNYLPFSLGLVSSSVYLKKKKNLQVAEFVSYVAGDTILKLFTFGVIGFFILLIRYFYIDDFNLKISLIILSFLGVSLVTFFVKFKTKSPSKIIQFIQQTQTGWINIRQNRQILWNSTLFHIISLVLIALQFKIAFIELDIDINFFIIILLTIFTNIIKIASLLPGNLGIRESISGFVTASYNISFGVGLLASIITRVVSMFWIFLFGFIAISFFSKEKKE